MLTIYFELYVKFVFDFTFDNLFTNDDSKYLYMITCIVRVCVCVCEYNEYFVQRNEYRWIFLNDLDLFLLT